MLCLNLSEVIPGAGTEEDPSKPRVQPTCTVSHTIGLLRPKYIHMLTYIHVYANLPTYHTYTAWERGGALEDSTPLVRRVMDSTYALTAT